MRAWPRRRLRSKKSNDELAAAQAQAGAAQKVMDQLGGALSDAWKRKDAGQ